MRKLDPFKHYTTPDSQRTDLTTDELLDILDFYLQYKPLFEGSTIEGEEYPIHLAAHDFTLLLYEYQIMDFDYFENLDKIREKYGKHSIHELSEEKLDFFEIITIFTFIHRADRHAGGWYESCIENNTYYNLLCRMEDIKNEL